MKKIILICLLIMLVGFAAVQYNDPDPLRWVSVYSLYALIVLSAMTKPLNTIWYIIALIIPVFFAIFQWPVQWDGIGDTMMNENTERARESLGLLICAFSSWVSIKCKSQ